MNDRVDEARAAVAPCLPGGPDADRRTSTVCWFVAGLADETIAPTLIPLLEARAHPAPPSVPYGRPDALARVLAARVALGIDDELTPAEAERALAQLVGADDLYLGYHLPFLASYPSRLRAQIHVLAGRPADAIPELERVLARRPADAPTLLQLAGAQVAAGQRGPALATLDRLTAVWPTADPDGHVPARAAKLRQSLSLL